MKDKQSYNFIHPFVYEVRDDKRSFFRMGMQLRKLYIRWVSLEDPVDFEKAVPLICQLVGRQWHKMFGGQALDQDAADPVVYDIIDRFLKMKFTIEYSFASWLKKMVWYELVENVYKTTIPKKGDRSIREFEYKPYPSAKDIENRIFVDDMKQVFLRHLESKTRLTKEEGAACSYIGETLMKGSKPSPFVLRCGHNISNRHHQFYIDFTTVTLRSLLYKLRDAIPYLYGSEHTPFIAIFELCEEDDGYNGKEAEYHGSNFRDIRQYVYKTY